MLQPAAFADLQTYIKKRIYKAQYKMNGSWHDSALVDKEVTNTGIVRIKTQISPGTATTITGVRLINTDGEVWALKTISVEIETPETNLLQWFDFEISEVEDS